MAELHDLRPAAGSHQTSKRKGRGPGSGKGKTAGRGQDGQKSRSGGSIRPGFEGGQMPLQRRIPKRGFTPHKRTVYQIVNVTDLVRVDGTTVNAQTLSDAGLIRSTKGLIKVLAMGEPSQAYRVEAHKFSAGAVAKIEAAGGSVTTLVPGDSKAPAATSETDEPEAALAAPAETDEPETASDAPAATDESAVTDEPADEPVATDEPVAAEESAATDDSTATDDSAAKDEAADQTDAENDG